MLGVAAGDSAGGAWELGYSAVTEQVTVISYQLIDHRHLDPTIVIRRIRELDGAEDEGNVYRSETPHFRTWLDRAAAGSTVPEDEPSTDNIARTVAIGVAFRNDPNAVVDQALNLGRLFHRDAGSVAAGVISASAVAASCFGQTGRDLMAGVAEAVIPAIPNIVIDLEGATWSSDRVVMTRISPPRHLGEFYGLYATVGRFATIGGPLVWAIIVDGLGIGRNVAMAALAVFVAAGWWILRKVDDSERNWDADELLVLSESADEIRR